MIVVILIMERSEMIKINDKPPRVFPFINVCCGWSIELIWPSAKLSTLPGRRIEPLQIFLKKLLTFFSIGVIIIIEIEKEVNKMMYCFNNTLQLENYVKELRINHVKSYLSDKIDLRNLSESDLLSVYALLELKDKKKLEKRLDEILTM